MRMMAASTVVGDIAADQWGLVTTPQAIAAGLSRVQLTRLSAAGALTRLSHGVYATRGAESSEHLELYAAWLALAPSRLATDRLRADPADADAVVSHASAAALFGLGDLDADRHEFTLPSRKQSRRPELRLHRGVLPPEDVTIYRGLPVATPTRTVVDLTADGHDGDHVAGVLADAVRTHHVSLSTLAERLAPFAARFGCAPRDGAGLLRHLLDLGGVSEQVDADVLADVARASRVPVTALMGVLAQSALSEKIAATAPALSQLDKAGHTAALHPAVAVAEAVGRDGVPSHYSAALQRFAVEMAAQLDLNALRDVTQVASTVLAPDAPLDETTRSTQQ